MNGGLGMALIDVPGAWLGIGEPIRPCIKIMAAGHAQLHILWLAL
jgi:hypothetical protein